MYASISRLQQLIVLLQDASAPPQQPASPELKLPPTLLLSYHDLTLVHTCSAGEWRARVEPPEDDRLQCLTACPRSSIILLLSTCSSSGRLFWGLLQRPGIAFGNPSLCILSRYCSGSGWLDWNSHPHALTTPVQICKSVQFDIDQFNKTAGQPATALTRPIASRHGPRPLTNARKPTSKEQYITLRLAKSSTRKKGFQSTVSSSLRQFPQVKGTSFKSLAILVNIPSSVSRCFSPFVPRYGASSVHDSIPTTAC